MEQQRSRGLQPEVQEDRKSTRLNSSHRCISYAVFCLKKKKTALYLGVMRSLGHDTFPVVVFQLTDIDIEAVRILLDPHARQLDMTTYPFAGMDYIEPR